MYGNENPVAEILSVLDKSLDQDAEWVFFAGTIFWARLDMFKPLLSNTAFSDLIQQNMGLEMKSGSPASIFHALERVVGLLPEITGMQTGVSHHIPGENNDYFIQILPTGFTLPQKSRLFFQISYLNFPSSSFTA